MDYEKILLEWKSFKIPEIFKRNYELKLGIDLVVTITGPRRAGKTFFCFQLMRELLNNGVPKENLLYINFEDEKLIGAKASDLDSLFENYCGLFEKDEKDDIYLFFDEIQNVENWTNWVRRIYDTKKNVKIVLTGSSSKLLSREIATNLRGRILNKEILPMSFKEYLCDFASPELKKLGDDKLNQWLSELENETLRASLEKTFVRLENGERDIFV